MNIKKFEKLVEFACGGTMSRDDVSSITRQLKLAKSAVVHEALALPVGAERKALFKQLNTLQYRLYNAIVCISPDESYEREFGGIADMIIYYDCK